MDDLILPVLKETGIALVGFIFLYIILQQYFKKDNGIIDKINDLCAKIDSLVGANHELQITLTKSIERDSALSEKIAADYIKIANKIEQQNTKIDDIHTLCVKVHEHTRQTRITLGNTIVGKGYMTKEQFNECLNELEGM